MSPPVEREVCAPLIAGQIRVPRQVRPFVERPRLVSQVATAPVTLVCGPAGAGKTTLLTDWAEQAPLPVAWVSLERSDDDPFRLWRAVLASLRGAGASLSPALDAVGDRFAPDLVNALAELGAPVALVLDDAHLLRSRTVRDQLGFLLLHMPRTLRVVLAARSDPMLALHVLRVRTSLTEIRAAELAFTHPEAEALLAAHGLELDATSTTTLHARTEGWAAGLRLAALGLQRSQHPQAFVADFAGDDRVVGDFLTAEVLELLPAKERRFLLRTAIADDLCGALAEAISGEPGGAETLERLAATTGFVRAVEDRPGWFRYHRLFAELLRARTTDRDAVRAAHRRAAHWYAERGLLAAALRHADAGRDEPLAVELLSAHWLELFASGQRRRLRGALAALPPGLGPELSAAAACVAFDAGGDGHGLLADAQGATPPALALARIGAARHDGDFTAVADLEASDPSAAVGIGVAALWASELEEAERRLKQAATSARAAGRVYLELDALAHLALARVFRHGPADATAVATRAAARAREPDWARTPAAAAAHAAQAFIAFYENRPNEACAQLERATGAGPEPRLRAALARLGALVDIALGRPGRADDPEIRARELIAAGELDAARAILDGLPEAIAVRAQLALAEGDPAAALAVLRSSDGLDTVERRTLEALALQATGAHAEAAAAMECALALAEASGHRWPFALPPVTRDILHACIRAGTSHRAIAGELLEAIDDQEPAGEPADVPLTSREHEILRLLATSVDTSGIATELGVSRNTVKTHLRSIYMKLDATDRRAAVTRARELHLLRHDER